MDNLVTCPQKGYPALP